jgi:predicted O-methyltransferase YrrM
MPQVDLELRHTENCQVLPDRFELLRRMPSGGIAAEVGAAFGDFTVRILDLARPSKLHLVDAWEASRYEMGLAAIQAQFGERIAAGELVINRGYSTDVLAEFPDGYFDWVYIDTNHTYETTAAELRLAAAKVKPGGLIAGHDFCVGNVVKPIPYGVIEACAEFCVRDGWQYRYLALDPKGHFSFAVSCIRPPD